MPTMDWLQIQLQLTYYIILPLNVLGGRGL